jgi:LacI family transcriptional regulator
MARITMARIATEAGVSKNAVSLALRADPAIPPATRARIERVARRLGYVRNPVVAELMSELRREQPAGYRRTLALLNANQDAGAFTAHPTIPAYVAGARARAERHGYRCDEFWLHDPQLSGEALLRILRARGIRGALVVGLMKENRLSVRFASLWPQVATVVTGVRTRAPTLHFSCVDHHALVIEAVEQARRLGYRRPALVVDEHIDRLVEGRFSAGMAVAQAELPTRDRVPGFYATEAARADQRPFAAWLGRHRPDVLLTLYARVRRWVEATGRRVPRDLGLVQLERRPDTADWAGMDQHNDLVGAAAVDMLVGVLHSHEAGVPAFPRATLVGGSWTEGATVWARSASEGATERGL